MIRLRSQANLEASPAETVGLLDSPSKRHSPCHHSHNNSSRSNRSNISSTSASANATNRRRKSRGSSSVSDSQRCSASASGQRSPSTLNPRSLIHSQSFHRTRLPSIELSRSSRSLSYLDNEQKQQHNDSGNRTDKQQRARGDDHLKTGASNDASTPPFSIFFPINPPSIVSTAASRRPQARTNNKLMIRSGSNFSKGKSDKRAARRSSNTRRHPQHHQRFSDDDFDNDYLHNKLGCTHSHSQNCLTYEHADLASDFNGSASNGKAHMEDGIYSDLFDGEDLTDTETEDDCLYIASDNDEADGDDTSDDGSTRKRVIHDRAMSNKRTCHKWSARVLYLILFLMLVAFITVKVIAFFRIRLRSRPAWLYGNKPMQETHVETCLKKIYNIDPDDPPPVLSKYDDKVYWEWQIYSNATDGGLPRGQTQKYSTYPSSRAQQRKREKERKRQRQELQRIKEAQENNAGASDDTTHSSHYLRLRGKHKKRNNNDEDDADASMDDFADDIASSGQRGKRPYNFRQPQTEEPKEPKKVLIAQYTGFGSYAKLLDAVAPVNKAYAQFWGYDYVSLQGTSLLWHGLDNADPSATTAKETVRKDEGDVDANDCYFAPGPRATFDKVALLEAALARNTSYDYLLILDTDAMIVDFDVDIADLMPSDKALMAQRVWQWDVPHTWDINAGITLWNLHHPTTQTIFNQWNEYSSTELTNVLVNNDDQYFLQTILLDLGEAERKLAVASARHEFFYSKATIIKHFKRETRSWSNTGLDDRMQRIDEAIEDICLTWPESCPKNMTDTVLYSERPPLQ